MNIDHLYTLDVGIDFWNAWRKKNPDCMPDLVGANLMQANLSGANLMQANLNRAQLNGANLNGANLRGADLRGADLNGANLKGANLSEADLSGADLRSVDLREANLSNALLRDANLGRADLSWADLSGAVLLRVSLTSADLRFARLVGTNLRYANLSNCWVYGLSVWDVHVDDTTTQQSLRITPEDQPELTVDNLAVAQFIYLLLNNPNIRHVIDTITSKTVLILGRFTPERKAVLDAMREELRRCGYLPILFDFEKPSSRDLTETVRTLAHMARFVIADVTDAKSIPQELMAIVPNLPSVPVQPLILAVQEEYAMFEHILRYPWVLEPFRYISPDEVIADIRLKVIEPAEQMAKKQRPNT